MPLRSVHIPNPQARSQRLLTIPLERCEIVNRLSGILRR